MKNIQMFTVCPSVPEKLRFLETLSHNMWWCWEDQAANLFRRIEPQIWKTVANNPIKLLAAVPQGRLEALAEDEAFLDQLGRVRERFEADMADESKQAGQPHVCYFSLEFGIHESMRIYSGGLGALAGDHLKSASDLRIPLAAVGLMYRQGYFQQYLDSDGMQQESYPENEVHLMPLEKVTDKNGEDLTVSVQLPEGLLHAAVWRLQVGRIPLYLLDANIPANPHELRGITAQLYGGDKMNRLRQELLLGIGGFRAMLAIGIDPAVCHMNEGHAAFLSLARLEYLTKIKKCTFEQALEIVPRCSVFTTHTPVPAGNECFPVDWLRPHLGAALKDSGLPIDALLSLATPADQPIEHEVSMTVLGLRSAKYSNGVSKLHGEVAREMWAHLWPQKAIDEVPIKHVTNGVHLPTWLASQNVDLFDRYIGPGWRKDPSSKETVAAVDQIPDEELWRAHELGRSRLIRAARAHAEQQFQARNATRTEIAQAKSILDHDVLTIGFARRFATYKRGALLLQNLERFEALLTDEDRPVQFLFAGKAHPHDHEGKELIRRIVHFGRNPKVRRHIVFLENYNMDLARRLVQGVDVWLNTPRRPMEASGTSGMKAAINGAINASILDGWWCEGYAPDCGWAIGDGNVYEDPAFQDAVESQALYNLLENEIVPLFYDRPEGYLPRPWVQMMRQSIKMALGCFSSQRMVNEYNQHYYRPAAKSYHELLAENARLAEQRVQQHARLRKEWAHVSVKRPVHHNGDMAKLHVNDSFAISTEVFLGELNPDEIDVELFYGVVNSENQIVDGQVEIMTGGTPLGHGSYRYEHVLTCNHTGRYAFTTRVTPAGHEWNHAMPGFTTWAE